MSRRRVDAWEVERDRETGTPTTLTVRRDRSSVVVGHAADVAEREAERIADEVLSRLPDHDHHGARPEVAPPAMQRVSSVGRAAAPPSGPIGYAGGVLSSALSERVRSARGHGRVLDEPIRRRMESALGADLGDVRIHTGDEADLLSRAISARAFTTGRDIFFRDGEYRPGTRDGQHVLAHELAHTQQAGADARRIHRYLDATTQPLDFTEVTEISPVSSGQPVFLVTGRGGESVVLKAEKYSIGLGDLLGQIHSKLSGVKAVRQRKLSGGERAQALGVIGDEARLRQSSLTSLGAELRARDKVGWKKLVPEHEGMNDTELGAKFTHRSLASPGYATMPFMVMELAQGDTASDVAKQEDTGGGFGTEKQSSRMRQLLTDGKHLKSLGTLLATDLFLGNGDRVLAGNIGNWFYDPGGTTMTVIDNVDFTTDYSFDPGNQGTDNTRPERLLAELAIGKLEHTSSFATMAMLTGIQHFGGDDTIEQWADAGGGTRRKFMEEMIYDGLIEGRKLLIKTFTATRFHGSKKSRRLKKAIKAQARQSAREDERDEDYYYQQLKSRAEWLKKH